jgi:hypothetical protein
MLLVYGDLRLYGGNTGYDDSAEMHYAYDNFVPNSQQLSVGDVVVLTGKDHVQGIAKIESIAVTEGTKEFQRCPVCGIAQSKRRVRRRPEYLCNNGHEFDSPHIDVVPCRKYVASYKGTHVPLKDLSVAEIRSACVRYNGQMSIQELQPARLRKISGLKDVGRSLLGLLPHSVRSYWAVMCNPDRYRFNDEYRSVTESVWMVPRGSVQAGDGLLIWVAAGQEKGARGVAAIGTILTDPEVLPEPPQFSQFWVHPQTETAARRVWVRYERCPRLPLLLGGPHDSLLQQLSVSRAQGTGAFRVTEEQWRQIVEAAGGIPEAAPLAQVASEFPEGLPEGRKRLVLHWKIERSPELARRKKDSVQRELGCLACECCGFNFVGFYGQVGEGFIEVHHRRPLHTLTEVTVTTLDDLAVVCSNCHRMLHRLQDCSVETLRTAVVGFHGTGISVPTEQR